MEFYPQKHPEYMVVGRLEGCFILALENLTEVSQAPAGRCSSLVSSVYKSHLTNVAPGSISLLLSDSPLCRLREASSF